MSWLTPDMAVSVLKIAAVLSTAAFGALALFTDYKKDGKVTRYGKIAVGGILFSAVISISVGLLQDRIADEREARSAAAAAAQRNEESARFAEQIGHLVRLGGTLEGVARTTTKVQHGMTATLRTQSLLMGSARQSLLATASVGIQERRNTARVLKGMWDDANRIDESRILVDILYVCPAVRGKPFPKLVWDNSLLSLTVAPPWPERRGRPRDAFEGGGLNGAPRRMDLWTFDQTVTTMRRDKRDGSEVIQLSRFRFSSLLGLELSQYADPESWRDAEIEVQLLGIHPGFVEGLKEYLAEPIGDIEELARYYHLPPSTKMTPAGLVRVVPCRASMTLTVNGRPIAGAEGRIVELVGAEEQGANVILRFPVVDAQKDALPRYAGSE